MKIQSPQLCSFYLHIFEGDNGKMLFNELYPSHPPRDQAAIVIIGIDMPSCIEVKNLNRDLERIFLEYGNQKIFFRFINHSGSLKAIVGNDLVYRGRQ